MYFFLIFNLCERTKLKDKHTKELFSQHGELLFVEASPGKSGELPAEDLRELAPAGPRRVPKESQVLWRKMEKVREAVKHKKMKTNISKTAGEHELQLQKNQSKWNISRICCHALEVKVLEFKSVFFLFYLWTDVKLRRWGWIARFICNLCHFDAVNRASVLGKPILETWKMQKCPVKIRTTEVDWKNKICFFIYYFILF